MRDFIGSLRPVPPLPAPASTRFDPTIAAANLGGDEHTVQPVTGTSRGRAAASGQAALFLAPSRMRRTHGEIRAAEAIAAINRVVRPELGRRY